MRSRWLFCVVAVALAVGACGKGSTPPRAERGPSDLLVLTSADGLTALDSGTGSVLFTGAATPALADGSELFATTHTGSNTIVEAIGSSTGKELSQARLRGDLTIRAVSSDGRLVALGAPLPAGTSPWTPQPRAFTDVVVADVTGAEEPMRFHLEGNFEPEAFSSDGETLYM